MLSFIPGWCYRHQKAVVSQFHAIYHKRDLNYIATIAYDASVYSKLRKRSSNLRRIT